MTSYFHTAVSRAQYALSPQYQEHNNLNYCIDSNQILLNDKDRHLHITMIEACPLRAKSAICDCLVDIIVVISSGVDVRTEE